MNEWVWNEACGRVGFEAPSIAPIAARYAEPHRCYHGPDHVTHVLSAAQVIDSPYLAPPLVLAIYLHDVIYDIPLTDPRVTNEQASTRFAHIMLRNAPFAVRFEVKNLILNTQMLRYSDAPETYNEAVLRDADLAGLSASWGTYSQNSAKIRMEFGLPDDELWKTGRGSFLRSMLTLGSIYWSPAMRLNESTARENMERELREL